MIGPLATLLQLVYALFLVAVGAYGILFLDWELATFYGIDRSTLTGSEGATLLNQMRFLKAVELSFGLFCLLFRRDILSGGQASLVFMTGLFLGVAARSLSLILDGAPNSLFVFFLVAETFIFVVMLLHLRLVAAER